MSQVPGLSIGEAEVIRAALKPDGVVVCYLAATAWTNPPQLGVVPLERCIAMGWITPRAGGGRQHCIYDTSEAGRAELARHPEMMALPAAGEWGRSGPPRL